MPSPTRALAWKEWREQRGTVLAGLILAASMPFILMAGASFGGRDLDLPGIAEALPGLLAFLVWPLFAAVCGASTVAGEIGGGTLGFLLSRPVSRTWIWLVKTAAGLAALGVIVAGSSVVIWAFGAATGVDALSGMVKVMVSGADRPLGPTGLVWMGAILLLYCTAAFFSTLVERPVTAALAGLALSLLIVAGILQIWSRLDLGPRLEPELLALELVTAGALILLGGGHIVSRGELLRGGGIRSALAVAVLVIVAGMSLIGLPVAAAGLRLSPDEAVLRRVSVSPEGSFLVATASTAAGASPQVWRIHADGSGFSRMTGRLTISGAISPDGRRIAYLSYRGALGLRSERAALRLMGVDGPEDRVLAEGVALDPYVRYELPVLRFSPDGARVAVMNGERILVAPVEGGDPVSIPLSRTRLKQGLLIGWTADSREALLASPSWMGHDESLVAAFDPGAGSLRIIHEDRLSPGTFMFRSFSSAGGYRWLPLLTRDEESPVRRLLLLDLDDGSVRALSDSACPFGLDLSRDGRTLAWAECSGTAGETGAWRVHVLDLPSMEDRVLGDIPCPPLQLRLSPSLQRAGISCIHGSRVLVLDDAGILELESGWAPLAWSGRNRMILEDPGEDARRLAVADVTSGELRELYP